MRPITRTSTAAVAALLLVLSLAGRSQDAGRITIIYDAFGAPSALQKDWGFAALVEYGGKARRSDST